MSVNLKRTTMCRFWERGDCQNGSRCMFAHGATQLRKAEPRGSHPEDEAIRAAIDKGTPDPPELAAWRADLQKLVQQGGSRSYDGLRPTARWALHELAKQLGLQHLSTGVGEARTLHICPAAPVPKAPAQENQSQVSRAVQRRRAKKERKRRGRVATDGGSPGGASSKEVMAESSDDVSSSKDASEQEPTTVMVASDA